MKLFSMGKFFLFKKRTEMKKLYEMELWELLIRLNSAWLWLS